MEQNRTVDDAPPPHRLCLESSDQATGGLETSINPSDVETVPFGQQGEMTPSEIPLVLPISSVRFPVVSGGRWGRFGRSSHRFEGKKRMFSMENAVWLSFPMSYPTCVKIGSHRQ